MSTTTVTTDGENGSSTVVTPDTTQCAGSGDLNRLYSRARDHEHEISGVKSRLTAVEARLHKVEDAMHEVRRIHADTDARINILSRDSAIIKAGQDDLRSIISSQTVILTNFITESTKHDHDQAIQLSSHITKATEKAAAQAEAQTKKFDQIIRRLIIGIAILGALTITLASIVEIVIGEGSIQSSLLKFLGLGL